MKTLFAIAIVALSFAGATAASAGHGYSGSSWQQEVFQPRG